MIELLESLEPTKEPTVWLMTLMEQSWDKPLHKEHHICYLEINNFNNGSHRRLPVGREEVTNLWYSHTEYYSRGKKNMRWQKKDRDETYQLSRRLKDAILQEARHAWWSHVWGRGTETLGSIRYWKDRVPPVIPIVSAQPVSIQ